MVDGERDIIGITMGCPVGIGPEIILSLFADAAADLPAAVVLGDLEVLERTAARLGRRVRFREWRPGRRPEPGRSNVCSVNRHVEREIGFAANELHWGAPNGRTGLAMASYIEFAHQLIEAGTLAGMVTCPITKAALREAGYSYPGHTEMLAALCGTERYAMMMASRSLKVTLVTIHQALAQVPAALTVDRVLRLIRLTADSLVGDFAVPDPAIAVAGLNPHAGEGGLFGGEEQSIIEPAVAQAAALGIRAIGPLPPDTVFHQAVAGRSDAVVCMYHDQGLIPFKLLHFADGVNVTVGLPIVRTSVDHGTAYDIAGKGVADAASLRAALLTAGEIIRNRRG